DFHVTGVQTCALPILRGTDLLQELLRRGGHYPQGQSRCQRVRPYILTHPDASTHSLVLGSRSVSGRVALHQARRVTGFKAEGLRSEERRVGKECRSRE